MNVFARAKERKTATTKRITAIALASMMALMLAMAATLFSPGVVQKAHAALEGMTLTLETPAEDGTMDSVKYNTLEVEPSLQLYGTITASGKWTYLSGNQGIFTAGKTYRYTATITAAGGIADAVTDPEYPFTFKGPQLKNVSVSLSSDHRTMTLTGEYSLIKEPSTISNLKIFSKDSDSVLLYWDIDEYEDCVGCALYLDGKLYAKYKKPYGSNVYQDLKVPYGTAHSVYVRAYDADGNYGAPSNTISVKRDLVKSPAPIVTKISANKVSIVWSKPSAASGVYIYANGKKIKSSTGKTYMYSAKGAAKKSYKIVTYVNSGGKAWPSPASKSYKAEANKKTGISPGPSYYGYTLKNYLNMSGLKYTKSNSKGKLKATFTITNCWKHVSTQTVKVKIKVKSASGKKIASQTFTVHGVKPWSKKKFTVSFSSAKTGCDIRTATMDYSIQVVR